MLKARARLMALPAVVLAVLEGISGMVLMGAALPTSGSLETASRMGILTAVLVALSSTIHMLKVRERNRIREASEGKRLYASIKYGIGESPSRPEDWLPEEAGLSETDGPQEADGREADGPGPQGADGPSEATGPPERDTF